MVSLAISIIILVISLIIWGILLVFGGYVRFAPYANMLILNLVWFIMGKSGEVWYLSYFEKGFGNYLAVSIVLCAIVYGLTRIPKVKFTYCISSGVAAMTVLVSFFLEGTEATEKTRFLALIIATVISVIFQLSVLCNDSVDDEGSWLSRIVAAVILLPAPFIFTIYCCDIISKPQTQKECLLLAGAVSAVVSVLYILIDFFRDRKEEKDLIARYSREAARVEAEHTITENIKKEYFQIEQQLSILRADSLVNSTPSLLNYLSILENETMRQFNSVFCDDAGNPGAVYTQLQSIRHELERTAGTVQHKKQANSQSSYGRPENNDSLQSQESFDLFAGCHTQEDIKKRYRQLCLMFHPDSGTGDTESFKRLQEQYEKLLSRTTT